MTSAVALSKPKTKNYLRKEALLRNTQHKLSDLTLISERNTYIADSLSYNEVIYNFASNIQTK